MTLQRCGGHGLHKAAAVDEDARCVGGDGDGHGCVSLRWFGAVRCTCLRHPQNRFRNGHCEVNNLFSIQIQSLDFLSNIIRHTKTPRRRWSSRRSSLAFAVHRMRVQDHFAGIMLPSVVGAGPPHHAWSVGSRVPISNGVLVLAGGTSDSTASSRPRPGEGTTEDRDQPDPIHGQVSFRAKAW